MMGCHWYPSVSSFVKERDRCPLADGRGVVMRNHVSSKKKTGAAAFCLTALLAGFLVCTPALAQDLDGHDGKIVLSENTIMPRTVVRVKYGASWDYGSIPILHGWSNLTSSSHWHSSTVTATGKSACSMAVAPGRTSYADLWWAAPTYNAYYDIW